jgi:hypothetical protein
MTRERSEGLLGCPRPEAQKEGGGKGGKTSERHPPTSDVSNLVVDGAAAPPLKRQRLDRKAQARRGQERVQPASHSHPQPSGQGYGPVFPHELSLSS